MSLLHPGDYDMLRQLFFKSEIGKGQQVLFCVGNECKNDLDLNNIAGVFDFGTMRELPGMKKQSFQLINNPDGSIRWMFSKNCYSPHFLKLYNGSGWRKWFFQGVFHLFFFLRLKRLVINGTVNVFYRKDNLFNGLFSNYDLSKFAVFTGTIGENRKAVFTLIGNDGKEWFCKKPLTVAAEKLVNREHSVLHELNDLPLIKTNIPKTKKVGEMVLSSCVRPGSPLNLTQLKKIHFFSLNEMSKHTKLFLPLHSLRAWQEINDNLKRLENVKLSNNLSLDKVGQLKSGLDLLYKNINAENKWATSIAHGDFTPWNMYVSREKIHLYDWELSTRQPLLFDAFHFIFQTGILVDKVPFEKIKERIDSLKEIDLVSEILGEETVNIDQYYKYYLLRNISYYLVKYIGQSPLHEQAHWLIETWTKAIIDINQSGENPQIPTPVWANENG